MSDVKAHPATEADKLESELKAKYGELYRLQTELEDADGRLSELRIYARRPHRVHLSRFTKEATRDTFKALTTLILDTVVWPDKDELARLFEERPGLVISLGAELQHLVGSNQDFLRSRL
ncbi:MAG: hypothetical protein IMW99_03655 [Firmicutes bacterium]|nr:hypothetical protein [Bacillota bacterium]